MSKFTFNNILIDDLKIRRGFALPVFSYNEINGVQRQHGMIPTSTRIRSRLINVPVQLEFENEEDLQEKKERLAKQLVSNEAKPLIFDIEPNRVLQAMVEGGLVLDEFDLNIAMGSITFVCHDPFKSAIEEKNHTFNIETLLEYGGTAPSTKWIATVNFTQSTTNYTFALYMADEDAIQRGLTINWNFQAGDTLVLDGHNQTITINGNLQQASLNWRLSRWFALQPVNQAMILHSTSPTNLTFTERFL